MKFVEQPDANKIPEHQLKQRHRTYICRTKTKESNSNLNFVEFAVGPYRALCDASDTLNTKYECFSFAFRTNECERERGKPKLFLLFINICVSFWFLFFIYSCFFFLRLFRGRCAYLASAPVDGVPFSHSAYIEFCRKQIYLWVLMGARDSRLRAKRGEWINIKQKWREKEAQYRWCANENQKYWKSFQCLHLVRLLLAFRLFHLRQQTEHRCIAHYPENYYFFVPMRRNGTIVYTGCGI